MLENSKKTNQTRRNRGYSFENSIVKEFNDSDGWIAKRLGSPSTALPDVMCVNDFYKTVIAIEAKSTVQNYAYVPQDQIERCRDWVNMFGVYDTKHVVLAFKFGYSMKVIGKNIQRRKTKIFYKVFSKSLKIGDIRADYDCNILLKSETGEWEPVELREFVR